MKKLTLLFLLVIGVISVGDAQTTLSHNVGNDLVDTDIYACSWGGIKWARVFKLEDFGITTDEEFVVNSASVGLFRSGNWDVNIQFNIYAVDQNFPSSFSNSSLIGSSQSERAPYIPNNFPPEIMTINFVSPVTVPADVEYILVEAFQLHSTASSAIAFAAGTVEDNDLSWFKSENGGCPPETYTSTVDMGIPDTNFYVTVNGQIVPVIPFEITATADCISYSTDFELSNSNQIQSVIWNFGDPSSGANNSSTSLNPSHTFTASGDYTVGASIQDINGDTYNISSSITVYDPITLGVVNNLQNCDTDGNNDGYSQFDLSSLNNQVLGSLDPSLFAISYHTEEIDAMSGLNSISNPQNFTNTNAYNQTIYARVQRNENSACYQTLSFGISTNDNPSPLSADLMTPLKVCDDESVGTDTDGLVRIDLTMKESEILNGQSPLNFTVQYFTDSGLNNQITSPTNYLNTAATETIFVRVISNDNNNCTAQTSFLFEVDALPQTAASVELKQCDDDLDGFTPFNLTQSYEELSSNHQNETISFHESLSDAQSDSNSISNDLSYINETVTSDILWARVENQNGCYRTVQVNLIVSTTQIPSSFLIDFYECDNGTNITDGIATFDFSSSESQIQDLFPAGQQIRISYYTNQANALAEINPIADISNYQNSSASPTQEIYVRVESELDNSCLGLGHHITLHVERMPVAHQIQIPQECDIDRDGVVSFDTSTVESSIVNGQTGFSVRYLDENGNQLPSPLPNPFSIASATITAQVINPDSQNPNGACYDETSFNFVVIDVPLANPISDQEECDTDFDNIVSFDTSNIQDMLLGNQTGMIVEYFDANGESLSSPLPNPLTTNSQTVTARVTNPQFNGCYDETFINFIVREKPTVELQDVYTLCITENPRLEIAVENMNNTYSYEWTNESGDVVSTDPTALIQQGGTYFITATSQFGCISDLKEIFVDESALAQFTDNNISLINQDSNNSIIINTDNLGIGDYEFALIDSNENTVIDFQDIPAFEELEGGTYTVSVRDKKGCGIVSREISFITFPQFFTPNNDGINDTWKPKGFTTTLYQNSKVEIFNRFGHRVATFNLQNNGWNGNYEGKNLPSNDYWYLVKLVDNSGKERVFKGNLSLIRR